MDLKSPSDLPQGAGIYFADNAYTEVEYFLKGLRYSSTLNSFE